MEISYSQGNSMTATCPEIPISSFASMRLGIIEFKALYETPVSILDAITSAPKRVTFSTHPYVYNPKQLHNSNHMPKPVFKAPSQDHLSPVAPFQDHLVTPSQDHLQ